MLVLKVRNRESEREKMKKTVSELTNLIETYDNMIEELVNSNGSDAVIGRLELKMQKLVKELNSQKEEVVEEKNETPIFQKEEILSKLTKLLNLYKKQADSDQKIKDIKNEIKNIDAIETLNNDDLLDYGIEIQSQIEVEEENINKIEATKEKEVKCHKMERVEKLSHTVEIYDDMIEKMIETKSNEDVIEVIKDKRNEAAEQINLIINQRDSEIKTIPNSQEVLKNINKLDEINDKIFQCRISIRRTTKNIFKIVTSPDYIQGELPVEINELLTLKKYKEKILEEESKALKVISSFFKAKITL